MYRERERGGGARPNPLWHNARLVETGQRRGDLIPEGGLGFGLYKIFVHLSFRVRESIIPVLPPPIWVNPIYDLFLTLPVCAIYHTILVTTISCKG